MQSLEKFFLDGHGGVDMTVSLSPSYTLPSLILKVRGQMGTHTMLSFRKWGPAMMGFSSKLNKWALKK